jgi:predicted amidohydrolase
MAYEALHSLEELFTQMEYFVDTVSAYKSDFAVFPELFNAPYYTSLESNEAEAMRLLAQYTPAIKISLVNWLFHTT